MDEKLLFLINREWTSPALDRAMALASCLDAWWPVIALAVLVLLIRGSFHMRACIVLAGLIIGINDGIISNTIKHKVDRPRPHQSHNSVRMLDLDKARPRMLAAFKPVKVRLSQASLEDVEGRSFPSSHTINTWSAAIVGLMFFRRRAWWLVAIAALVSYSRIYTGSHWPSDVLVSIFIGCGSTLLLLTLASKLWQRVGQHFAPQLHAQHPRLFPA
jgi:undecaprenyl-diphosphatase